MPKSSVSGRTTSVGTISVRVARGIIRAVAALPEPVQRLIAGKPVEMDGQRLSTEVQMGLRLLNALPDSESADHSLAQARKQTVDAALFLGLTTPVGEVRNIDIPTRAGSVAARVYVNDPVTPVAAAVVYFHGGGWVVGGLDSTDSVCRYIAAHANVAVISVDYRLAPEHRYPAGLEDAVDAYRWVRVQQQWGDVVVVAGDSAGATFSAAVCAVTLTEGAPDYQLLFYPATDLSTKHRSYELFGEGFFLTSTKMDWYRERYLNNPAEAIDPLVSPLLGEVSGHPPAHVVVAGFDVLRDEGLAYADKLEAAGVSVTRQIAAGHIHAFVNVIGAGKTGRRELALAVESLRAGIAAVGQPRVDP